MTDTAGPSPLLRHPAHYVGTAAGEERRRERRPAQRTFTCPQSPLVQPGPVNEVGIDPAFHKVGMLKDLFMEGHGCADSFYSQLVQGTQHARDRIGPGRLVGRSTCRSSNRNKAEPCSLRARVNRNARRSLPA